MWRVIAGPISGYIAMVVCVILCIAIVWFSLGPAFAFEDNTFNASLGWTITMLICGLGAAVVGGIVAKTVGGNSKAVVGLAGLILVMGVLTIVGQSMSDPVLPPEGMKPDGLSFNEAGQYAKSPMWYNYSIIVAGIIGALVGGSLIKDKPTSETS